MLQQIRFFLTNEYYTSLEPGLDEICAAAMNGIPEGAVLQLSFTPIPEKDFSSSFDALSILSPAEPVPQIKKSVTGNISLLSRIHLLYCTAFYQRDIMQLHFITKQIIPKTSPELPMRWRICFR